MLKQIFRLNRDYREAKNQAVEHSINVFEAKTGPRFVIVFLSLIILAWLGPAFITVNVETIYDAYGILPVIICFVVSYFAFYLSSKMICRPTAEELSDDTSFLAILSACKRKERRSFVSIGFAVTHTFFYFFYLIGRDPHSPDIFKFGIFPIA